MSGAIAEIRFEAAQGGGDSCFSRILTVKQGGA